MWTKMCKLSVIRNMIRNCKRLGLCLVGVGLIVVGASSDKTSGARKICMFVCLDLGRDDIVLSPRDALDSKVHEMDNVSVDVSLCLYCVIIV